MDTELYDLCKEVYKRTEWSLTPTPSVPSWYITADKQYNTIAVPHYTSDYLLEKMPFFCGVYHDSSGVWRADVHIGLIKRYYAATPLKALLKLVIALDDAGELK
jgi:hypothetical protein